MKIQRIEIKKLYGSFSRSIDLDKKLTLLVGINGSGKTSILNCIDWMLRPDLPRLATTRFDSIRLFCSHIGKNYVFHARQEESRLVYSEEANGDEYKPVTVDFIRPPSSIHSEQDFQEVLRSYRELNPEAHERKLWKLTHELPNPLTITLDRSIAAEVDDAIYLEGPARVRVHKSPVKSPLLKVVDVTRRKYAMYRERVGKLNDDLKTKIVLSAFKDPFSGARSIEKKVSLAEISKLESKVTSLLYATTTTEQAAANNVATYFQSAKQMATQVGDDESFRYVFWTQFRQIHDLAAAFDEYEKKASTAYESLKSYLEAINTGSTPSSRTVGLRHRTSDPEHRFCVAFVDCESVRCSRTRRSVQQPATDSGADGCVPA